MRCSVRKTGRRGAVTVEMALVAPIFVAIMVGMAEASRVLESQNLLSAAAREGARLAAMDRGGLLNQGQTTNQKVTADVQNFLTASGVSGADANVFVVDPADHTTAFDFDDPANELKLFELRVELPFTSVCGSGAESDPSLSLVSKIVFRNARFATGAQ